MAYVRDVMDSCGVPRLEISTAPLFRRPPPGYAPGHGDLQLTVEGNHSSSRDCILEVLPADLASFLDVDEELLNQHMAYITGSQNKFSERGLQQNYSDRWGMKGGLNWIGRSIGAGSRGVNLRNLPSKMYWACMLLMVTSSLFSLLLLSQSAAWMPFTRAPAPMDTEVMHRTPELDAALAALTTSDAFNTALFPSKDNSGLLSSDNNPNQKPGR